LRMGVPPTSSVISSATCRWERSMVVFCTLQGTEAALGRQSHQRGGRFVFMSWAVKVQIRSHLGHLPIDSRIFVTVETTRRIMFAFAKEFL
jgi:hypothetical protein